jgi:hypothetical protein
MADWFPLLKLITILITTAHYIGILYYSVGKYEEIWLQNDDSWITKNGLNDMVFFFQIKKKKKKNYSLIYKKKQIALKNSIF